MNLGLFILQVMYFFAPAGFANMAPPLMKWLPFLNTPVDCGRSWLKRRIFGAHKTWRGVVFGIVFAIIISLLQRVLYPVPFFRSVSLIDYSQYSFLVLGLLFGTGAMLGDLIESFLKRRLGYADGESLIILDQIDWVLMSLLLVSLIVRLSWQVFALALVLGLFLHILIKHMGYLLKLECKPW